MLAKLADWLVARILAEGRRPDLIVGHKLTIEGIVAQRAAKRLRIPYAISIQGDTDTRIMAVRRDLVSEFREVLKGAAIVFPFAPWAFDEVLARLQIASVPHRMLPCPTDIDAPLLPVKGSAGLVSVFHLKNHKRKNFARVVQAMQLLEPDDRDIPGLTVIGGGTPGEIAACNTVIAGSTRITLAGEMDREQVRRRLNQATAFVLPSLRETFGLVFIEALFAGTPVIYPKGTAIDGYFDGCRFAIAVNARDPRSIAEPMARACREETALKEELAAWQASAHARQFMRPAIAVTFGEGLRQALAGSG
jgi:glycosyltransferase involved in cell wall biosynthesis